MGRKGLKELNWILTLNFSQITHELWYPVDTGHKLKVQETPRRSLGRLLNVLCTFSFRPVPTGYLRSSYLLNFMKTQLDLLTASLGLLKLPNYSRYRSKPGQIFWLKTMYFRRFSLISHFCETAYVTVVTFNKLLM